MKMGIKIYGILVGLLAIGALIFGIKANIRQIPVDNNGEIKFGAAGNMLAEEYIPYVLYNEGYNSNKPIETGSTLDVAGATTLTGALSGAAATFTGAITGASLTTTGAATVGGQLTNLESYEILTASNTIAVAESNKTFYISGAASTSTLPAVGTATGTVYRFVIDAAITGDVKIVTSDLSNIIEGALIVAGAVVDCDAEDAITFVGDGENLGDFVELRSNGTKWFIGASGALASSKLTCTTF